MRFPKRCLVPLAGLIAASAVQAQSVPTRDITFNFDVRIEGNRAAIDTGIRIACAANYMAADGESVFRNAQAVILEPGDPAPASIPVSVTIPDFPVSRNYNPNSPDEAMNWGCQAYPANGSLSTQFLASGQAVDPVASGTCPTVRGTFNVLGEVSFDNQYCAP